MSIFEKIQQLPDGYSEVMYEGKKYGLSRTTSNAGKSIKVFADQLGGKDFISFNYYITKGNHHMKPCEMPEKKVLDFLAQCVIL